MSDKPEAAKDRLERQKPRYWPNMNGPETAHQWMLITWRRHGHGWQRPIHPRSFGGLLAWGKGEDF